MAGTRHLAWFGALLAVAIALLALGPSAPGRGIEARGAAMLAPVVEGLRAGAQPLADVALSVGHSGDLARENADLRLQVARLESEIATLRESSIAAEQAAALIEAVDDDATRFAVASVTLRDPSPARSVLLIDRGTRHGVRRGQPVVGPGGTLVGVVSEVADGQSRVRLLDDPASAVTAVVQNSRAPVAVSGGPDGLRLEFAPTEAEILEGDLVLSSPLGGRLPAGLPIGRVATREADERALFQEVRVAPLADYARLEQVLVMTGFSPASPGLKEAATLEDAAPAVEAQ